VSKGLSVACFTTAAEYIVAQRDERPACLILDLILPDLDGLEIQSRLVGRGLLQSSSWRRTAIHFRGARDEVAIDWLDEEVDRSVRVRPYAVQVSSERGPPLSSHLATTGSKVHGSALFGQS
jgi:hypothetical protein